VFVLVDEHTEEYCLPLIASSGILPESRVEIRIPSGEENKTLDNCKVIWDILLDYNASRHSCLIVIGGGMLSDMGGLAASLFKRGMHFIFMPTTLLAQVDASVGGKTAVNYQGVKNIIGCFNAPDTVIINPDFLETLPEREFLAGFGEMLKHGLIADPDLFKELIGISPLSPATVSPYLLESISIKSDIVQRDPKEKMLRKVLNFGHTLGHGLESVSFNNPKGTPLLHGEAVMLGMIGELFLAEKLFHYPESIRKSLEAFFKKNVKISGIGHLDIEHITDFIFQDKKNRADRLYFSLPSSETVMKPEVEVPSSLVREGINYVLQFMNENHQ